jgi:hypothetical protein
MGTPAPPPTLASPHPWRSAAELAAIAAGVLLLWRTPVMWPLKVLVVFFHELSHGLAAIATGGAVERIEVVAAQGGLCVTRGGSAFLTLSAGYLGSLLWGAAALLAAARSRRDRGLTAALGAVIVLASVLWVRPLFSFGFGFHLAAGLVLIAVGAWLPEAVCDAVLKVFGVASCLYVVPDIWSDTIARSGLRSDARMLAELTGIPTVVWGAFWIAAAAVIVATAAAAAARPRSASPDSAGFETRRGRP